MTVAICWCGQGCHHYLYTTHSDTYQSLVSIFTIVPTVGYRFFIPHTNCKTIRYIFTCALCIRMEKI